jgi:adenylosuccinate synthase
MINGVTELNMLKTDVLDTFETIKICTQYRINGELTDQMPFDINEKIEPVYTDMKGWQTDLTKFRTGNKFPSELNDYIKFIEESVGVPISLVSVGPDREQTLFQPVSKVASV